MYIKLKSGPESHLTSRLSLPERPEKEVKTENSLVFIDFSHNISHVSVS